MRLAEGLYSPLRSRFTIAAGRLPEAARRTWPRWRHEPPRQSLRWRQGGKLHEDIEGRGSVFEGLRNIRGLIADLPRFLEGFTIIGGSTPRARLSQGGAA